MTDGIKRFFFFHLGNLDGVFKFKNCQFRPFDYNILLLHPNYFK